MAANKSLREGAAISGNSMNYWLVEDLPGDVGRIDRGEFILLTQGQMPMAIQ